VVGRSLALGSWFAWMAGTICTACTIGCTPEAEQPEPPEVPEIEYCDAVRDWDPAWSAFEDEVLVLLNEQRAAGAMCGDDVFDPAEPLRMDPALRCAARKHALDMGEQDYFSNLDLDGLDFHARAEAAGYAGTAIEQNIGAAHSTPEQLVKAVMGHIELCTHVMTPEADELGMGYLEFEGASYPSYWAQTFGQAQAP
jgi:uncharacterized protein YkwD